ncbi:MAG: Gfo/Idh/MocA family oxidoreductase [Bacteroidia bacterium]|nr:MAG: Gfo/Idh/MocA family oxidoreductase [Bacteroidia bacterium]
MKKISRKEFFKKTGVITAGVMISPALAGSPMPAGNAKKTRVGLIGCGSVSHSYLPHLSACPYAEIVSACDIRYERAVAQAGRFNIPHTYPHIDQMLAGAPFDLLVNLTDMQEHGRLNKIALTAGKNVWSEKPLASTVEEGKELLELAKEMNVRLWGAPVVVNSPQFAFMAEAIRTGKLGKISSAHAHYGHLGPTWSAFFYEKGGGSLPDLGVYNLATLTGLLGPAKYVTAMTSIVTPVRNTDNKGEVKVEAEDNAMVLMDHGNGILSHVQSGFNYFDPYGHTGTGQDRPTVLIWGTRGNMGLVGYDCAPFGVALATTDHEEPVRHANDALGYVWQEGASVVAETLATGKETLVSAEHSLHVLEIIEAARKSGQTGERIRITTKFKYPVI